MPRLSKEEQESNLIAIKRILRAAGILKIAQYKRDLENGTIRVYGGGNIHPRPTGVTFTLNTGRMTRISTRFSARWTGLVYNSWVDLGGICTDRALEYILYTYPITANKRYSTPISESVVYAEVDPAAVSWAKSLYESIGIPRDLGNYTVTFELPCTIRFTATRTGDSAEVVRNHYAQIGLSSLLEGARYERPVVKPESTSIEQMTIVSIVKGR